MAKQVHNMNDLISDIQNRIKKNDTSLLKSLKDKHGKDFYSATQDQLRVAADKLRSILEKYIHIYFDNYHARTATGYSWTYKRKDFSYGGRTGQFENSLRVAVFNQNNDLYATVYFDDAKSWRDSIFGFGYGKGYLPALLNDGYRVKSGWHSNIHHFGYFEGAHFIEAAVAEAKNDNTFDGIEIIWASRTDGYGMNY